MLRDRVNDEKAILARKAARRPKPSPIDIDVIDDVIDIHIGQVVENQQVPFRPLNETLPRPRLMEAKADDAEDDLPVPIEYECPHCLWKIKRTGQGGSSAKNAAGLRGGGRRGDSGPEDLIVVKCPACEEDGQHAPDSESDCDCGRRLVLDKGRPHPQCRGGVPEPRGECGVVHSS